MTALPKQSQRVILRRVKESRSVMISERGRVLARAVPIEPLEQD